MIGTLHPTRSNPFGLLAVGLLVLLAALGLMILASTHAVIAHGQAAISAQNCFNGNGVIQPQVYLDPLTGRTMRFCNEHGKWYVSIDAEDGRNVTMFPRSLARCLRDVTSYAERSGFTRLLGPH